MTRMDPTEILTEVVRLLRDMEKLATSLVDRVDAPVIEIMDAAARIRSSTEDMSDELDGLANLVLGLQ